MGLFGLSLLSFVHLIYAYPKELLKGEHSIAIMMVPTGCFIFANVILILWMSDRFKHFLKKSINKVHEFKQKTDKVKLTERWQKQYNVTGNRAKLRL